MKMYTVTSSAVMRMLNEWCLPSIKRLQDPTVTLDCKFLKDVAGNGDFGTKDYKSLMYLRYKHQLDILRKMDYNEVGVFTDIDILFLQRFKERLLTELADNDIVFQKESDREGINCGFIVFRKTKELIKFYESCEKQVETVGDDQSVIKNAIHSSKLKWNRLSNAFSSTNTWTLPSLRDRVLFHAINTIPSEEKGSSLKQKYELFEKIRHEQFHRELVVARYKEDVKWLRELPFPAIVYDKSPNWREQDSIHLGNIGREAHTYLYHIIQCYDSLAEITFFTQGDPFFHSPNFLSEVKRAAPTSMVKLGTTSIVSDVEGCPNHCGLPIREFWEQIFPNTTVPQVFEFGAGALMAVSKASILKHKKSFYEQLLTLSTTEHGPWVLERLWPRIFA